MLILLLNYCKCKLGLSFGEALAIHKEPLFGAQRIHKCAWDLQNFPDGHKSKFVENIIKQVLQEVNQIPLNVAWYPVGEDTHVKDIELLLRNEVHMVGIGGIGKTNLAKR
ncbi:uncharacterized protein LOC129899055 isoform X2 [Solanum dulcamara]|nr:uncharacterized protein LOC129899055 isoform X2 [Solanum dulcamara]